MYANILIYSNVRTKVMEVARYEMITDSILHFFKKMFFFFPDKNILEIPNQYALVQKTIKHSLDF